MEIEWDTNFGRVSTIYSNSPADRAGVLKGDQLLAIDGKQIRQLYADRSSVSPDEELVLFLSDRRQHVVELINPSLALGKIVLSDRYYLSTAAYQGTAGFDPDLVMKENEKFAPAPDLALIIELPPSEAVRRIQEYRSESLNDFEQEEELAKVDGIFKSLKRDFIQRINGLNDVQQVHELVMDQVNKIIP